MPDERARRAIWVFGSNLRGIHGAGSAKVAADEYGAQRGVGSGRTGNAYAIPTMARPGADTLALDDVRPHIAHFLAYARAHADDAFLVTRIGCGIAGFMDEDIAPLFKGAPPNCIFAPKWREIMEGAA
jgi:hypothetical protein